MYTKLHLKRKISTVILLCACMLSIGFLSFAQTYDPLAVQRINDLIANNGLQATPDAPETWTFAEWNDENPKKIINLGFGVGFLKGDASFAGLTTLQMLSCDFSYLTKLDLTNCLELQELFCMDNYLTEIIFNSKQLQRIGCSKNKLSKLDIADCDKLYELDCYKNNLTELDVRNCTQLNYLSCYDNHLIAIDLSKLDSLLHVTDFKGHLQYSLPLTLYKNESGTYSFPLNLNSPVFGNTAISYENGNLISKDSTVFFSSFTVQTGKTGFELSGTMNFNYSNDVGIDAPKSLPLNIYPNPNTGELIVTNDGLHVTSIEIYDINGRKQKVEGGKQKAESEIVIDISHLQAGVYFVKVVTEKGEITEKIIKK